MIEKIAHRRERYQQGSLKTEARQNGPAVYVYRWREPTSTGGTRQKKVVLGTIRELTKTQAQKLAEHCREAAKAPEAPLAAPPSMTVSELVEHFTQHELDGSEKSAKYVSTCHSIFKLYLLPRWGAISIHGIKALEVESWLRSLDRANGTKAAIRRVFSTLMRHALRHDLVKSNPISQVRQAKKRAVEPEILEPSETAAVIRELQGIEPVRTAFIIAALMGMRRSEVFGLQWHDVDFDRATLHVRRAYVDGVVGHCKTDTSRRPLPVPPPVLEALKGWRGQASYRTPEDWVFASDFHFGKAPLWPGILWRRHVGPAIQRAGITKPKLGWHSLRRGFASLLLATGASVRASMELMRHADPEMTLGTYAQTIGNEKRDAGEKVALLVMESGKAA